MTFLGGLRGQDRLFALILLFFPFADIKFHPFRIVTRIRVIK